jgi:hypothetical protein
MRPLGAHCHLGLGKLYRRTGQREQARAHLTVAAAMYGDMEMAYWLEQVEAELGPGPETCVAASRGGEDLSS